QADRSLSMRSYDPSAHIETLALGPTVPRNAVKARLIQQRPLEVILEQSTWGHAAGHCHAQEATTWVLPKGFLL
ncbi:MAG: hypothetical protein KTR25_02720, partial [Myxococcales bacterium]|nr:hypothetical protein [Myxococcales bacterium]